jgi:L-alanine-DL-glutamate epimerase-like enolase superfamily enzyme
MRRVVTQSLAARPMRLRAEIERWPLTAPFRITGYAWEFIEVLLVSLEADGLVGRGEAAGIYYKNDTPASMLRQIESLRPGIEAGIDRDALQCLLPSGGTRNALDCALWDLEAKIGGIPVWETAQVGKPRAVLTTFTCGADDPQKMAWSALGYRNARAIKLKLTGEPIDAERVSAVRDSRKDVWLAVDANQGFTRASLERLMPSLVESRVSLIEQPFPVGQEALLDGFESPIPIAADESVQGLADIRQLVGRFQTVNIKLDKCGGLTEALAMARTAQTLGLNAMVGNMMGTSLAMAPAFLVGQLCTVVDLDGPALLKADRSQTVQYEEGLVMCPETLWGGADSPAPSADRR